MESSGIVAKEMIDKQKSDVEDSKSKPDKKNKVDTGKDDKKKKDETGKVEMIKKDDTPKKKTKADEERVLGILQQGGAKVPENEEEEEERQKTDSKGKGLGIVSPDPKQALAEAKMVAGATCKLDFLQY